MITRRPLLALAVGAAALIGVGLTTGPAGARGGHDQGHDEVTICHRKGNGEYVTIVVDDDGTYGGHGGHEGDLLPAPAEGCPTPASSTTEPPETTVPPPTTTEPVPTTTEPPATTTEPPATTTEPPATTAPATTAPETTAPPTTQPPTTNPATFDQDLTATIICGTFRGQAANTGTDGRARFTVYVDGNQVDQFTLLAGETHPIVQHFAEDTGVHTVQVDWAEGPSAWTVDSDCKPPATDIGTPPAAATPAQPDTSIELPETK